MINILELIEQEQANGYSAANASAKICQDLVLRALASGPLNRNVTIRGGRCHAKQNRECPPCYTGFGY